MKTENVKSGTAIILHYYAQAFAFPYEEMNYELQHLYRSLEREIHDEDDALFTDQILSSLNLFQGEEIIDLRGEYVALFTSQTSSNPRCPLIASDFCRLTLQKYDSLDAEELIYESGIPVNTDEPVDSIINYLQYLSFACEEFLMESITPDVLSSFYDNHIVNWIPQFCDILYRAAGLSFYKEIAIGLKDFVLSFNSEF